MDKPVTHQARVVVLGSPRIHTNADTLELFDIEGYQVVVKKGEFVEGSHAIYIQPDSVVLETSPFEFLWKRENESLEGSVMEVPIRKRRITVKKLRGEWSEGLLMPLSDFPELKGYHPQEGDDISDLIGITHYDPDKDAEHTNGETAQPRRRYPRTLKGWFFFILYRIGFRKLGRQMNEELSFDVPKYDVEALKNHKAALIEGEAVIITEKIHGSQGRYVYRDGGMHAGSKNFWKAMNSDCIWRKALKANPWIEDFCKDNEGWVLYGEVTPTQKGYNYGTTFPQFFVFDIRSGDGGFVDKKYALSQAEFYPKFTAVPILYEGPYDPAKAVALATEKSAVDGAMNAREGVVITAVDNRRIKGLGRVHLKLVSNSFYVRDK